MPVAIANPCVASGQARGSTPRTRALAELAIASQYGMFAEQRRLAESAPPVVTDSQVLRQANAFAYMHARLTPVVRDGELIVGARVRALEGDPGWSWYPDGLDSYITRFAANTPPDRPDLRDMALRGLISPQGSFNHKAVDYAGYIRTGSRAIAQRARSMASERAGAERDFCTAYALGHEAIVANAAAYAAECDRLAATAHPARAAELREIARVCRVVPAGPATTFHEALQSLWFAYLVAGDATGRPDVYLREFFEADLARGLLTPERGQELVECFLIKLHGDTVEGVINVSSIQTMTLGGVLPDGSDASSGLTLVFLRAARSVRLLRPTIYVRLHDGSPADALDLALVMLGEGLAEPNFYGDRPIIEGLTRIGVPLEHARDYALAGCTEIVSPGRGNWGAPNGWINLALLASDAIEECRAIGGATAEDLWRAVERGAEALADACRDCNVWVDENVGDTRYLATLFMPCTLDRCKDVAHGGAETYYGHWEAMGLPNAADMLYAAADALERGDDLSELLDRVKMEDSQTRARLRRLPKFGNGVREVDAIAARVVSVMAAALERRSTPLRKALVMGHLAGGENMHIPYGRLMGPTLDGRRGGQTLADSLAGSQGQTTAGPTALLRSLCALDHSRLIAGNVSTLGLHPRDFADARSRSKVAALVRSFVAMGGSQLQINVVDAPTLRAAQERPEEYRGLLVRVAGYSADFTSIGRSLQDEIIARTEGLA